MKRPSWLLILVLLVLHQDYWNWTSDKLWFDFLPVQLGYHIIISLLACLTWWVLVTYDWPLDEASEPTSQGADQ